MTSARPPRFLVLLCTHNGQAFLSQQLASLAAQTLPLHALEVHDWASGDDSLAMLRGFQKAQLGRLDMRITVHEQAPGPAASFLRALRLTLQQREDFDFLLFCDQDDLWHVDKLRHFAAALREAPELDLIYSDIELIDAYGRVLSPVYLRPGGAFGRPMDMHHGSALFVNVVSGMSMGMSRNFLERGRSAWAMEGWVMHDWAMCVVAYLTAASAHFIPLSLVSYRQHGSNVLGAIGAHRDARPWRSLWRQARSDVQKVHRQYQACARLTDIAAVHRLDAGIGRFGVALSVLRGKTFATRKAIKVALVLLLFWPGGAQGPHHPPAR